MPDYLGGAVGIERWELIQKARGNEVSFSVMFAYYFVSLLL